MVHRGASSRSSESPWWARSLRQHRIREQERNQLRAFRDVRALLAALYGCRKCLPCPAPSPRARMVHARSVGGPTVCAGAGPAAPPHVALVDGESRRPGKLLAGRRIQDFLRQRLPWGRQHCTASNLALLPAGRSKKSTSLATPLVISSSHLGPRGSSPTGTSCMSAIATPPVRYAWDQCTPTWRGSRSARGPLVPGGALANCTSCASGM